MNAPLHRPVAADDEVELSALLSVLWARRRRLAAAVLLGVALAVLYLLSTPRIYQADALLQLEKKNSGLEGLGDLFAEEPKSLAEVEIFRSRRVLGTVVDRLDLTRVAAPRELPLLSSLPRRFDLPAPGWAPLRGYSWGDAAIHVTTLRMDRADLGVPFDVTITGPGRFRLDLPDGRQAEGSLAAPLEDPATGLRLRIDRLDGPPGRRFTVTRLPRLEAINRLREALTISEVGRGTEILRVQFRDPDPARAERVLTALTEAYLEQNIARNAAEVSRSLAFVREQLPAARARLDDAQEALNAYREAQNSVDLSLETAELLTRITELKGQLSELDLREQELRQRYRESHPVYQRLLASRAELRRQLAGVEERTETLPETQKEILNLSQDLEVAQTSYLQLVNTAQQLELAEASTIGNVRILDRAAVMPDPVAPRAGLVLALSALVALAAGTGAVLLQSLLRGKVGGIDDIEQLGLTVYGVLSRVNGAASRRPRRGRPMPLVKDIDGADQQLEALRSLRTSLHFGLLDKAPRAILLTSAAPGDGKSFVSANLAAVAAMSGQKVCIVDADLRRGYLDRYFGVPRSPGLSEYLAGDADLDAVVTRAMPDHPLHVIPTGKYPPNPSELIMGPRFARLTAEMGERFDLIIFDAPPVLAVTDPIIIARHVPLTLAVLRHGVTELGAIRAMKRVMDQSGQAFSGVILNDYRAARAAGNAYDYHYAYSYAKRPE